MSDRLADEHEALRDGRGARRRRRDLLVVGGPDAAQYLQGQCSQDLAALAVGSQADSLVLTPEGKVTALVRVVRVGDEEFVLDTDAGAGPALAARLARFRLRAKLSIDAVDWPVVALRGLPVDPSLAVEGDPLRLPFAWHGWTGVDLLFAGGEAPADPPPGYRWCGDGAWEACRIEAGVPRTGAELDERTIPAEVPGLVERTVSFTKGCFTGQELVARLDARGNRVARRLVGVVAAGAAGSGDPGGGAVAGALVQVDGKEVGRCTSATRSAEGPGIVALAYLHRSVEVPAAVGLVAPGDGRVLAAEARPLPLR
ncbi:MAG: CAF17-like 4Fe-4S cluster assembly/insertion protein YgfZ [Acidimicrobiales bacterium]